MIGLGLKFLAIAVISGLDFEILPSLIHRLPKHFVFVPSCHRGCYRYGPRQKAKVFKDRSCHGKKALSSYLLLSILMNFSHKKSPDTDPGIFCKGIKKDFRLRLRAFRPDRARSWPPYRWNAYDHRELTADVRGRGLNATGLYRPEYPA
jgi:hypothetical protein